MGGGRASWESGEKRGFPNSKMVPPNSKIGLPNAVIFITVITNEPKTVINHKKCK